MRLKLYRGIWAVVARIDGRTVRKSLGTADRQVAERRFRDFRIETPGDTVEHVVGLYLKDKEGRARSHEAMRYAWAALKPSFGHLRPDQVDRDLCRRYIAKRRAAHRSDGTILKELSFLRAALQWAKKPGAAFEMPPAPAPRERHLTREEYDRLLAACAMPHIRLFVILALATAGRASAILELTWDRIDFERNEIRLSKGEERRKGRATVRMTERARGVLMEMQKLATCDHVIEWAGEPVKSVKRAFREAVAQAKLKNVTPHVLRHTAAVWAAEAGVSMEEIGQFLGHTDSRVTYRVYARFSRDHQKKITDALE